MTSDKIERSGPPKENRLLPTGFTCVLIALLLLFIAAIVRRAIPITLTDFFNWHYLF